MFFESILVAYEVFICLILTFKKKPLLGLSINDLFNLIGEIVVIKLGGDEWEWGVDGIVLSGYVVNGSIPDEDGEDKADDGSEYLAAVGTRLSFLQM